MSGDFRKAEKDSEEFESVKKYTEIFEGYLRDNCKNHDDYVDFINAMIHIMSVTIALHLVKEPESKMLSSFNQVVKIKFFEGKGNK